MIEEINKSEIKSINRATEQIHTAAQYLSMAGKFLSEPKDDDSHTNMGWLSMKEKFISNPLGTETKYFLSLHPATLTLGLLDHNNHLIDSIALKGLTQKEGSKWIKSKIKELKITPSRYKMDIHYDLPDYANMEGKKFKKSPKKAFAAFSKLRNWADYYVNKYKVEFSMASETRTWPHHFDHASYIPLTKLKSGEVTKSLSMGLAIHDGMINEPYFYISAWAKNKKLDLSEMTELSAGYWLNVSFKGAVLPVFDITSLDDFEKQQEQIDAYFTESIAQLLKLIKYNPKTVNAK